jgi:hypothetical protein
MTVNHLSKNINDMDTGMKLFSRVKNAGFRIYFIPAASDEGECDGWGK